MEKKTYTISQSAGPLVAGLAHDGRTIELTAGQAEHPLRLGHIFDPTAQPFGGKGDHDGDGKPGGAKKRS